MRLRVRAEISEAGRARFDTVVTDLRLETIHGLQTQLLLRMHQEADGGGAIHL